MRGIKIKIKFRKTDTYAIDILKFRDIDNTQYFKSLFLEEFDIIKENFPVCMKNIHEEFQVLKSILSRVIKHPDIIFNFIDFYQEISNIVHAVENNFEEFEIDAFREIERYASIENNKNNVFDIILLRKRFYIELFNYICLIYKSKRALRKIFDSQKKFEVKAAKSTSNREGRGRHQKQENSISIMRNKEANDSASKMSPNMALSPKQNTMLDENNIILPELSQQSKKDSMKLNDVLSIDHPTNEFDFCENLVEERRRRKSSIEVVREEKVDLTNTELVPSPINNVVGFRSEVNEIMDERLISAANENSARESVNKAFTIDHENEVELYDDPTLFEDFEEAIAGDENSTLDQDNFVQFAQGLIYLDNGINEV